MKRFLILLLCLFTTDSFSSGIGNVSSAPCDNETLSKYTGTANVEINWEPNTINLNWYDGDTKLTVANNSQTCVYDGTLTVPTQPTKPGYTFNGWKVIHVPGGFTELEYIESTGTQLIDTGLTLDTNLTIVKQYMGLEYSQLPTRRELTGGPGNLNINYFGVYPLNNKVVFEAWAKGTYAITANTVYDIYFEITNRISLLEVYQTNNRVERIKTSLGSESPNNIDGSKIYMFNVPDNSDLYAMTHARISYYKIYFDGDMVRNFIPARRNSDNVVGMYDSITNQFFTNDGTGAFIAGPAVQ